MCWAAEECNALGLTPCPSLLPAVSQAGSQTTSHQREIDEWWDLEGMHNKKEEGGGVGGGAAMTQSIDATSKVDLKIARRKDRR